MKVAIVSKSDLRGGGASAVAQDLTSALSGMGHAATHFHVEESPQNPLYGNMRGLIRGLKKIEGSRGFRDHNPFELLSGTVRSLASDFDIVHMHDLSRTLSHKAVGWISRRTPVLWTLHDCSPFTAGCIYPQTCTQFHDTCQHCPHLGSWPLETRKNRVKTLHERRKSLRDENVHFSAPSHWMMDQYRLAQWPEDKIHYVTNAVDTETYKPQDRSALRAKHRIPDDGRPVFLFAASYLGDHRKGPEVAAEIAKRIKDQNPVVVLVGRYMNETADMFAGIDVVHLGFVKDTQTKAEIFAMCDASFVFSKYENCPLVVLESLASGTPVIAFANGGIVDLVEHGKTGFLSDNNAEDIISALKDAGPNGLANMRERCRQVAVERHTMESVCNAYLDLYRRLASPVAVAAE